MGPGTMGCMSDQDPRIVVIGPDGSAMADTNNSSAAGGEDDSPPTGMVSQPDKVMRIGTMIKQLLEEVRAAPLDDRSRVRLRDIHASSIRELADGLSPDLRAELERISLPLSETEIPSDAELRIAQAQLVGWLEGLFHGLQAALMAQQVAARSQLEQMRGRALSGPQEQHGPGPSGPYL
jgi:hypothetical protein